MSQASVAQIITSHVDRRGISRHTATANAMRPILPISAPAASLPRLVRPAEPSQPPPESEACSSAFPAIFPASATLVEKHEKKNQQHGLDGTNLWAYFVPLGFSES